MFFGRENKAAIAGVIGTPGSRSRARKCPRLAAEPSRVDAREFRHLGAPQAWNERRIAGRTTSPPDRYRTSGCESRRGSAVRARTTREHFPPIFPQSLGEIRGPFTPKAGERGVVHHLSTDFLGILWWARQGLNL
jgi:hypothetical protein